MTDAEIDALCDQAREHWLAGEAEPAVRLWTQAADAGSVRGHYNLGVVAEARHDIDEAKRQYALAIVGDSPFPLAFYNLGVLAISDQDLVLAAEMSERAANLGVGMAALNRGQIASWSGDLETAKYWWERAAELGDDGASAYNLGIHANDEGDRVAARRWFARSAELGYPDGMNNLAVFMRQDGDIEGSTQLYERAAGLGSTLAMRNLAELEEAVGNPGAAEHWLSQAAAAGDADAPGTLARLRSAAPQGRPSAASTPPDWSRPQGPTAESGAFCTNCGAAHGDGDRFCPECGTALA